MPKGRPKGSKKFDPHGVAVRMWKAVISQGRPLKLRFDTGKLLRGEHSLKVAVAAVARELKCSTTTVWQAWSVFNPLKYELRLEKRQFDFECDMHHEYRHEEALESLQREFGNQADFSEEEIEERARELDDTRCFPDY